MNEKPLSEHPEQKDPFGPQASGPIRHRVPTR
jgi:hypothetical protein